MLKNKTGSPAIGRLLLLLSVFFCQLAEGMPVASFTADQTSGCTPLTVQFTSTSTGAASWYWDLGNGNSSTLENPSNVFTIPGSYTVTLIAYDGSGNADTARFINLITVFGRPTADFSANATTACPDNNLFTFTNTSTGGTNYLWDFGDGTTSTQPNPTHSYTFAGTFTVTLIAMNGNGCQDVKILNQYITIHPKPDPTIVAATTSSCDPNNSFQFENNDPNGVVWDWTFSDFTTSNLQIPSHIFPGPGTYFVSLVVTNSFGCIDTTDAPVQITVGLNNWADFLQDVDSGCAALSVQFSNTNAAVATSFWDFGDGNTSNQISPSHTYSTGGSYTVTLIVTTSNSCADTVVKPNLINVGVKPDVSFQYTNSVGCSPLSVQFTNTSQNYTSCEWFFGDGTTSTAVNPVHTYTNGGNFSVTLQCWGPTGCSSSMVYQSIVTVTTPQAIYNAAPRVGCPPLQTSFTALVPGNGAQYFWDFGDGSTSSQQNPTHLYTTSGNFDVTLIVTDSIGCTDTIVKPNYVQTVNPAANYVPPPVTTGCVPLTAQFTDATLGSVSWLWDFGDGTTSTLQNPTHTYNVPGLNTVSLTTSSAGGGCSQTISNFSTFDVNGGYAGFTSSPTPCPPYIATFQDTSLNAVSWFWGFGDGNTSTLQNPAHTYLSPGYHSTSLTITTADGCTYSTVQSNGVYFTPFGAHFYGVPLDTIFPVPVQWYANSVGATSWVWDFGDSTGSTLENPIHNYPYWGMYDVTLIISNGTCSLTYNPPLFNFGVPDSTPVDVGHGPVNEVQKGCTPLNVLFTNKVSGAATWQWDFGDGGTSNVQFPMHVYSDPGIYSVSLTTTDTFGFTQVLYLDSIVWVSGPTPGFYVTQNASCTNTQITITDTSSNASSWLWNMGDGTMDNVQNPVHTYAAGLSNYIITQTVTDTMGCSASISTSIFASFVSPILVSQSEVCGYDTIDFFTSLQNYSSYLWDFGDGQTSTLVNPSHTYAIEGTFNVTLTVTDYTGCSQTFNINPSIKVKIPVASFTTAGNRQACNSTNIAFLNTSQNADSYLWDLGDGTTTSIASPIHLYSQAGLYDVSLTVYRGSCISTISYPQYIEVDTPYANFTYTNSTLCLPVTTSFIDLSSNAVSWKWFFGNGDTSMVQNPVYTYTTRPLNYPILTITDIHGCVDTVMSPAFPMLVAAYTTSADSGCFPLTVQFVNYSSAMTTSWQWDFGDGTTSTLTNPTHTYAQPGNYDVTLVVECSWANCSDTLHSPARIKVKQPHADFNSTDVYACAPSLVNFTNLSTDADSYLWDFGDGTTSTNVNPSHIYNTPGIYNVSLVTTSSLGCGDSILKGQYISVLGPVTHFSSSPTEGCEPFSVSFYDSSFNAVNYSWNFGDGYSDLTMNPVHTYQDTGNFTVSLVTTDTSGCTSFYEMPQHVVIHPSPVATFTSSNLTGCQPFMTSFNNTSTDYQNIIWDFGDGDTSSTVSPLHQYLNAGTFNPQLIAFNAFGCADTAYLSNPITVLETPIPQFSVSDAVGCAPFHVTFLNTTTNTNSAVYLWDFGNGNTSTLANPSFDFSTPGTFTVSLTVTNSNGCSANIVYPSIIHVEDSVPPAETKILSVSVESNTTVKIIWENNPALDLAAYVIYRNDPVMNIYHAVYTETNVQNTNFVLTSEYTDVGLNTLQNTYTYKVQAIDICANSIPLDSLTAHTTVNISSARLGPDINVTWTPYEGCPVSSYELYRARPGDPFTYLTTVPPATLSYLDTTFDCPIPYAYKVMATDLCGNTYTSYSDTSVTIPLNILEGQIVDVVRSTVIENQSVLTEWKQPDIHPEKVDHFDIYRSTDNTNFYFMRSVPSIQTDYMDDDVDVQNDHYYYKILVINTCDIAEDLSDITSTIILKGNMDEGRQVHLGWSPYSGWDSGVDYYIIEKKDENGVWRLLKQVSGSTLEYDSQE